MSNDRRGGLAALPGGNTSLAARARRVIPGGVSSVNRALPWPLAVRSAAGAHFTDADGRTYLDYHAAFGPYVLGHNHPVVNEAVRQTLDQVDLIGAGVTEPEVMLAETLNEIVPSAERVLFANSGSEATYAALRLARAVTGRTKIVKFQGTYHGWHDAVALNVISPPERIGKPDPLSLGTVPEVAAKTIVLRFNDTAAFEEAVRLEGPDIAAVIVEVIPHNIGCVLPRLDYLQAIRRVTREHGIVLIFDEVVTGFRHALGGYQSMVGIVPDITVLAKAMANGFPIAAVVGKAELMDWFEPGRGVFFAGTYNAHPVNAAAALATISVLRDGSVHARAFDLAGQLGDGIASIAEEVGVPITVARFGSVVVPYFMEGPTDSYEDLLANDGELDVWFRRAMCERGIFMMPTALKRNHISAAHTQADIDMTLDAVREVLGSRPIRQKAALRP